MPRYRARIRGYDNVALRVPGEEFESPLTNIDYWAVEIDDAGKPVPKKEAAKAENDDASKEDSESKPSRSSKRKSSED